MPSQCVTRPSYLYGKRLRARARGMPQGAACRAHLPAYSLSHFLPLSRSPALLPAASARVVDRCALSHVPRPQQQHAQQLIIISCSFQAVLRPRSTTSRPPPPSIHSPASSVSQDLNNKFYILRLEQP